MAAGNQSAMPTREEAQRRADRIGAFRAEVEALAREGGPAIDAPQLEAVRSYHDALLARLAAEHDVDRTRAERQMSLGMRIASLLGAAALTAAVVSFVYRVWGTLPAAGQVTLLTAAPLAAAGAMLVAARLEKTRYVASLFAIVACAALVMQTVLLGRIFNLRDSPHALAVWAAFALAVAVPWRFALPFAFGLGALAVYAAGSVFWWAGFQWTSVFERPETLILAAVALLAIIHRVPADLRVPGRSALLLLALVPLLALSSFGQASLLPVGQPIARVFYQFVAVAAALAVIGAGLRAGQRETVLIGSMFAAIFVLARFVDWWWDWMPKYLFFLILTAIAVTWLWALRVVRRRLAEVA